MALPERQGLYDPRNEHDSCGIGFVANINGRKSHDIVARGLQILEKREKPPESHLQIQEDGGAGFDQKLCGAETAGDRVLRLHRFA